MSEHSPNLNLNLYSEADGEEKFRSFMEKLAGLGADSNMMLLDAAIKAQAEKLKKAAVLDGTGKLPESLLPEIGAEHIPFVSSSLFQAAVGDASNVSEALENIGKVSADAYAHIENTNNPHGVTAEKINAVPVSRTINGQPLSDDITLSPSDIGITGKSAYCIVVGTTTAGHTLNDCDYLCDGVDDQVEINQAISNAHSHESPVVLLSGNYILSAPLENLEDIEILGSKNTILDTQSANCFDLAGDYVSIRNITLSGTINAPQSGASFCYFENCNASFYGQFNNSEFIGCKGDIRLTWSEHTTIFRCIFHVACTMYSDHISFIGCNSHIKENDEIMLSNTTHSVIVGNIVGYIQLGSSSNDNVIVGNYVFMCKGTYKTGIFLGQSNRNAVIGNVVYWDDPTNISTANTIKVTTDSSYNLIADNLIFGKNYSATGGTGNTFVNNKYN